MQRKTSDTPTRIYKYGADRPTKGGEVIEEQIRLATRYYNRLVELERSRRVKIAEAQRALPDIGPLASQVDALKTAVEEARALLKAKRAGAGRRADVKAEAERVKSLLVDLKPARAALREAKARLKEDPVLLAAYVKINEWVNAERRNLRAASGLRHGVYARVEMSVEQASKAPPPPPKPGKPPIPWAELPRFSRYDGEGYIGTQLTGDIFDEVDGERVRVACGITVAEALSGQDTRLRIFLERETPRVFSEKARAASPLMGDMDTRPDDERLASPPPKWGVRLYSSEIERVRAWQARPEAERLGSSGRHQSLVAAANARAQIRVGSNLDRTPIWAEFPIVMHRALPTDGVIKWAYAIRRRVGPRSEWSVQITLEAESFRPPAQPIGHGVVAINFGWRNLLDDTGEPYAIRSAYWVDDAGRDGEVLVPAKVPIGLDKADDLRAIRDRSLDTIRPVVTGWLRSLSALPAWAIEKYGRDRDGQVRSAPTSAQLDAKVGLWHYFFPHDSAMALTPAQLAAKADRWRSPGRFVGLLGAWRRAGGEGDVFEALSAWAKQDRHLYAWQESQRDRRIGHRRMEYQKFAVNLARTYATILTGDENFSDFAEAPKPEDGVPSDGRDQRRTARRAAPGELREEIVRMALKYGAQIVVMRPAWHSQSKFAEAAAKRGAKLFDITSHRLTQRCAVCGCEEPWDAAPSVMHRCVECGTKWDQDANYDRNLLREWGSASTSDVHAAGEVLAQGKTAESKGNQESASVMTAAMDAR